MKRLLVSLLSILMTCSFARAEILFEENFDSLSDWVVPQTGSPITCRVGQSCTVAPPGNFYDYRTAAIEGCSNTDGSHHTLNINSLHARGGSGKSFMMWNEPCVSSGGSWGSDGLLGIDFAPQSEVYVSWWMYFPPEWVWNTGSPMQKFLHMSHYNNADPSNLWNFSLGTQNKPRWAGQFYVANGSDGRGEWQPQTSPLTAARDSSASFTDGPNYTGLGGREAYGGTVLWPGDGTTPWSQTGHPGDGQWHQYQIYLKLNSAGGVADGIARMWYDGVQIQNRTNLTWISAGDDPALWKWNHAWMGGNNSNYFTPAAEQYNAVDDVVVSTTFIPLDYQIGNANGVCGTASGSTFASAPTANLCSSGVATAVAGTGPWTWGCNGVGTGTSTALDACSATKAADVVPPITTTNRPGGRYAAKQLVSLSSEQGATVKYCLAPGCTPSFDYSTPIKVLQNLAIQTLRYSSTDAANNTETIKELVFRKQRKR